MIILSNNLNLGLNIISGQNIWPVKMILNEKKKPPYKLSSNDSLLCRFWNLTKCQHLLRETHLPATATTFPAHCQEGVRCPNTKCCVSTLKCC